MVVKLKNKKNKDSVEKIKNEILEELQSDQENKGSINWGSITVTVILAVLLVFSLAQTVQSATILNKVKSGSFGASSGNSPLPSDLTNLPDMVGGC